VIEYEDEIEGWKRLKTTDADVDSRIPDSQSGQVAYANSYTEIMEITSTGGIDLAPKKYILWHKQGFSYDKVDIYDSKEEAYEGLKDEIRN